MQTGDIDFIVAQRGSQIADNARLIVVGYSQHITFRNDFHGKFIDAHDSRIIFAEYGAGGIARFLRCFYRQRNHVGVIFGFSAFDFDNLNASFLGNNRRVDIIDGFRQNRLQKAL